MLPSRFSRRIRTVQWLGVPALDCFGASCFGTVLDAYHQSFYTQVFFKSRIFAGATAMVLFTLRHFAHLSEIV